MAYSSKRPPKMPAASFMDSARDGSGLTMAQKRNKMKMRKVAAENAAYKSMHAEGQKASARARKAAALAKGAKHRPAGSPSGGQFY